MEEKKYTRLSFEDRHTIELSLRAGKSKSAIALLINRSRSTVTRELKKWIGRPGDKYDAKLAHWQAQDDYLNKRNLDKIKSDSLLRFYVYRNLSNGYSPEQISGRLKIDYPNSPGMRVSYECIYQHIYGHRQSRLGRKLIALLPYGWTRRRKRKPLSGKRNRIKEALSIDFRPNGVESREELGDWEGDLVIGVKQQSAIGTLVERKTRYVCIVKLSSRKSEEVTREFSRSLAKLGSKVMRSLTYDNGMEMANHKWFTAQTGMPVYFAHPYHSWERGTNENTNGLIRRYFPKKTDFSKVSDEELQQVANKLNNRPRKVLGYYTPKEMMEKELKTIKKDVVMRC